MTREITFDPKHIKTYLTADNARAAVRKAGFEHIRHMIVQASNGRFHPVFFGQEAASEGVHFHFPIV